jgi:hypothetical protein
LFVVADEGEGQAVIVFAGDFDGGAEQGAGLVGLRGSAAPRVESC